MAAASGGELSANQRGEAGDSTEWGLVDMASMDKEHGVVIQLLQVHMGAAVGIWYGQDIWVLSGYVTWHTYLQATAGTSGCCWLAWQLDMQQGCITCLMGRTLCLLMNINTVMRIALSVMQSCAHARQGHAWHVPPQGPLGCIQCDLPCVLEPAV